MVAATGAARYLTMLMTVPSVVCPKSPVLTIAVADAWPVDAPLGIVVVQVAVPSPFVRMPFDVTAGTPGTASVNVTRAPWRGRPSGSATDAVSVTRSGSFERLIEYAEADNDATS